MGRKNETVYSIVFNWVSQTDQSVYESGELEFSVYSLSTITPASALIPGISAPGNIFKRKCVYRRAEDRRGVKRHEWRIHRGGRGGGGGDRGLIDGWRRQRRRGEQHSMEKLNSGSEGRREREREEGKQ